MQQPEGDEPDTAATVPADPVEGPGVGDPVERPAAGEPDGDPGQGEAADPREANEIAVDPTRVRRAPRFGRFVTIGVLLGMLAAFVQTRLAHPDTIALAGGPWASNTWGFFWLMCAIFVPIGALLMCGLALLLDRRSRRQK
ncbi:hypothetical protein GCM10027067_23570 [Pseudactinotalea suaedae]